MNRSSTPQEQNANELQAVQQWMQRVISHPSGVRSALKDGLARGIIDVNADTVDDVISPSKNLSSIDRLQIYHHAYFARLIECLRTEYPALHHALGDKAFDGFAATYLVKYPSNSYTLANLGANFPTYLIESRREHLGNSASDGWADFLIDLARVERVYAEVFDGLGIEELPPFDWNRFQQLSPQDYDRARILFNPAFRLLELNYPVHQYITDVRRQAADCDEIKPTIPAAQRTLLAITRRDYVVHRAPLLPRQFILLQSLWQGESLTQAIECMLESESIETHDLPETLHADFKQWTQLGYIHGAEIGQEPSTALR